MLADVNILEKDIGRKGVARGDVRPVKAMILGVTVTCSPPHLHYCFRRVLCCHPLPSCAEEVLGALCSCPKQVVADEVCA